MKFFLPTGLTTVCFGYSHRCGNMPPGLQKKWDSFIEIPPKISHFFCNPRACIRSKLSRPLVILESYLSLCQVWASQVSRAVSRCCRAIRVANCKMQAKYANSIGLQPVSTFAQWLNFCNIYNTTRSIILMIRKCSMISSIYCAL